MGSFREAGEGDFTQQPLHPLIPAKAGIQMTAANPQDVPCSRSGWIWVPAFAGMSGGSYSALRTTRSRLHAPPPAKAR